MGAVSKQPFWQVAEYFLGTEKNQAIRVDPKTLRTDLKEEVRAEKLLQNRNTYEGTTKTCEIILYDYLKSENCPLTPELKDRITLQSEKATTFIFNRHTLNGTELTLNETKLYLFYAPNMSSIAFLKSKKKSSKTGIKKDILMKSSMVS